MSKLNYLLVFVPITLGLRYAGLHGSGTFQALTFLSACLAVLPLAGLMGHATEELAKHYGSNIGGLLNATFGNMAELIITFFAIRAGLLDVVQASITGSIIGNLLLVLGLAILAGGRKRVKQTFNPIMASMHSNLLVLAIAGLMIPAVFVHALPGHASDHGATTDARILRLSLCVAAVLMFSYFMSLWFSIKTHQDVLGGGHGDDEEPAHWTKGKAIGVLGIATAFVAWMSEILVHGVEPMAHQLGLSPIFVGVIVIPIIGNAAEHATAVVMAMQNKMDVALGIAVGSSTQIALFVAPILVFISLMMGKQLSLVFTTAELVAVAFAVAAVAWTSQDGETHWLEGVLLLALYVIIALAFFFVPPPVDPAIGAHGAHGAAAPAH